jgi:acyl dehydratase
MRHDDFLKFLCFHHDESCSIERNMRMTHTYVARGRYFEEFTQGDIVVSAGRTITEADIVNFAGLAGDYTQIHTNAEFAKHSFFGQRVAHGLLLMAIASGLLAQLGFLEGTVLAFRELIWKFSLPVFIGDTIHAQATVTNLKTMKRLGGGAVTLNVQIINQNEEVVQSGQWILLIASQPERVLQSP